MLNRRHQGELLGVIDFEIVGIKVWLDGCRRRRLGLRVGFTFIATKEEQAENCREHQASESGFH
jgi:hypothetical protein